METSKRLALREDLADTFGIQVSNTTLLRWEQLGRFPRRLRLAGTTVCWRMDEIEQWLEDRSAERANHHYAEYL